MDLGPVEQLGDVVGRDDCLVVVTVVRPRLRLLAERRHRQESEQVPAELRMPRVVGTDVRIPLEGRRNVFRIPPEEGVSQRFQL